MEANMKVGDTLLFEDTLRASRSGKLVRLTVTKAGRKWLTLSNGERACIETLKIDGGQYTSPGRCYRTFDDYADNVERKNVVRMVHAMTASTRDLSVTLDQFRQVAQIMGIDTHGMRPKQEDVLS
jgi:hypothetical protein